MGWTAEDWQAIISGQRRGLGAWLLRRGLWFAQGPYALGVGYRNFAYDRGWKKTHCAAVPVISVGNLTVGGTGKTPCVEYIARFFRQQDILVSILSRGYGASLGRNDEAMLLEENLPDVPHYQGADRVQLAETAVQESESEVLILDDGFQHRRLHRDLNIVLIDATNPWGYGYLLPRGMLREPVRSLQRADLVMLTRCQPDTIEPLRKQVQRWTQAIPIVATKHEPLALQGVDGQTAPTEIVKQQTVAAFCGIGNPEAFRQTLRELQADPKWFRIFPDHHPYSREDVQDLLKWASQLPEQTMIVTTQKDWVKLRIAELAGRPLYALRIGITFLEGQQEFDQKLAAIG